ncbi:MAG: tRNA(Arg) A34 adenosine deaminase TadA [Paraglaciecola psychrophila]|jgi:tRNA(Arg) A34 adenosine deaminase TadA
MNSNGDFKYGANTRRRFLAATGVSLAGLTLTSPLIAQSSHSANSSPPPPGTDPNNEQMLQNLRRANDVAAKALAQGHHPFGAILVAADHRTVLLEQGNIDAVNHAESTLARRAAKQFSEAELWTKTLYSTAEPCVMCAGTQYWANIGRLVYGMSEEQLLDLTGNSTKNPTLDVPSRYVFSRGQKGIKVWGPIDPVVEEIAELHKTFWKK